jgi:DNA-binding HxlR family transcriptional regulator
MVPRRKSLVPPPPESCPLNTCMKYLGGAWTPNLIWYLAAGPRRFTELKHDLAGISSKMLTTRLRELTDLGILVREQIPTSPPTVEYRLTKLGLELKPAINAIASVGMRLKEIAALRKTRV